MDIMKKMSSLQEISKIQLSKILHTVSNKKYLILDPNLIRPLEKVCGVRWLKEKGVEKIFKLEPVNPDSGEYSVFYMIYLNTTTFKQVVDQIRSQVDIENSLTSSVKDKFHIIVIPCYTCIYERELEELGLWHSIIKIHHFQWMPLYLDIGLLSLEMPDLYNSLFVYQNLTYLPVLSKCLWHLSFVIGKPPLILAIGQNSKSILSQFDNFCTDKGETDKLDSDLGALIIIDRNIDYPSALLTPGTYAALLSEVYTVCSGICDEKLPDMPQKLDEKCNPVPEKHSVHFSLDSKQDSIYCDIKNRYFTEVTSVLSNLTKQLRTEKNSSKEMALDEIKYYIQTQLQSTKSKKKYITNHLLAAESIIKALGHRYENQINIEHNIVRNTEKSVSLSCLDELLNTENNKYITLRFFCLLALFQPMNESDIRTFWLKFLHQFGFHYGFAFQNLITLGFIPQPLQNNSLNIQGKLSFTKFSSSNCHVNAKNMKQIPPDPMKVNFKSPTCTSYVYGGNYIPLITQIAGMLLNSIPIDEIKTKLEMFGPLLIRKTDRGYPLQTRIILIFVIGGVTYAEIAACNLLESVTGSQILILSDNVITGNDLMKGILDYPK